VLETFCKRRSLIVGQNRHGPEDYVAGTPARPRCGSGAFTLVELLVVIGIIALLVSILLPSLTAARRASQRTACASKLHSIMIAAQLHRSEHDDYYPLAGMLPGAQPETLDDTYSKKYDYFSPSGSSSSLLPRQLCPLTTALETEMQSNRALYSANGVMAVPGEAGRESLMLDPHGLTSFFICPAQATSPLDIIPQVVILYGYSGTYNGWMAAPQSYIFNEHILGWNDAYGNLRGKASMIHQPNLTMFAADGLGGSTLANHQGVGLPKPIFTVYNTAIQTPATLGDAYNAPKLFGGGPAGDHENFDAIRHRGKINVAFCDGHVETRNLSAADLGNIWISAP